MVLSWDITNPQSLNIYRDENLTDLVANVTGENNLTVNPIESQTYYLDYGIGIANVSVSVGQDLGRIERLRVENVCSVKFSAGQLVLSNVYLTGGGSFRKPSSVSWGRGYMKYVSEEIFSSNATTVDGSTYPMKAIEGGYLQNYGGYKYFRSVNGAYFDIRFLSPRNITKVSFNNRASDAYSSGAITIVGYNCQGEIVWEKVIPSGIYNEVISTPNTSATALEFYID